MTENQTHRWEWEWDLTRIPDPHKRASVGGLYRLLNYGATIGEGSLYPDPTELDIEWSHTDTTLKIAGSPEALATLMARGFPLCQGVWIPPGYPTPAKVSTFPASVKAHQGLKCFTGGTGSSKRTKSAGKPTGGIAWLSFKGENREHALEVLKAGGYEIDEEKSRFKWPETLMTVYQTRTEDTSEEPTKRKNTKEVTPHLPIQITTPAGVLQLGKPFPFDLMMNPSKSSKVKTSGSTHPHFTAWNARSQTISREDAFLYYFSPLGYIYTAVNGGILGLAIDGPTFNAIDKAHRRHLFKFTGYIAEKPELAVQTLVATLRLAPQSTYAYITDDGQCGIAKGEGEMPRLRAILLDQLDQYTPDPSTFMHTLHSLPLAPCDQRLIDKRDKDGKARTLTEMLYRNLLHQEPWYMGLSNTLEWHLLSEEDKKTLYYPIGRISRAIQIMYTKMEDTMTTQEQQFVEEFSALWSSFKRHIWHEQKGAVANTLEGRSLGAKANEKAIQHVLVKYSLRRATTTPELLHVINEMCGEIATAFGNVKGLTMESLSFLRDEDPAMVKELMSAALFLRKNGTNEPAEKANTEEV
jgi:hypothetical protein